MRLSLAERERIPRCLQETRVPRFGIRHPVDMGVTDGLGYELTASIPDLNNTSYVDNDRFQGRHTATEL